MNDLAISVQGLSKCYRLGAINRKTLSDELSYLWCRLRGQDPHQVFARVDHADPGMSNVEPSTRRNQDFWALKDVSFDVKTGEMIGVIGRNGAGKSTLLKILTRITEPTTGEALIEGRVASLLEVGTGFHPELTGRENVYMNGTILGMKRREIAAKFDEIVAFAELSKFIDTPVKRYSSGMYVRLAFAVAAHLDPEILLIDEVLAVGDAGFQRKCLGKMSEIAGQGRTVLFVSHNMASVRQLTERCLVLDGGQICFDGASAAAIDFYRQQFLQERVSGHVFFSEAMRAGVKKQVRRMLLFEDVRLSGYNGETKGIFVEREPITITLGLQARLKTHAIEIVIQIKTLDEVTVTTISSGRIDMEMEPGYYTVSCELPAVYLAKGHYKLLLYSLSGNRISEDCLPDAILFDIESGEQSQKTARDVMANYGDLLIQERTWSKVEKTKHRIDGPTTHNG